MLRPMTASDLKLRFHKERDRLLAEAHARPSTPLATPALATRIVSMSGEAGIEGDRRHMAALCRKFAAPEPGEGARWCLLEAGPWSLRWERHTEASTWTVFRPGVAAGRRELQRDGARSCPARLAVRTCRARYWWPRTPQSSPSGRRIFHLRPMSLSPRASRQARSRCSPIFALARIRSRGSSWSPAERERRAGRPHAAAIVRSRNLSPDGFADLSAGAADHCGADGAGVEIDAAAAQVVNENGVDSDRNLVNKLAALAGRAERLAGQTNFRVAASRAYYGLVGARIASWNEQAVDGRPTLGEFMERRLAPAMRTSGSVAERLQGAIDRIARTVQILNTRVEVASEIVNVDLLASMDKRSKVQLRLQETVEGLSIVAVSYYALSLLKVAFDGVGGSCRHRLNPTLATALSVPVVLYLVWRFLRRVKKSVLSP